MNFFSKTNNYNFITVLYFIHLGAQLSYVYLFFSSPLRNFELWKGIWAIKYPLGNSQTGKYKPSRVKNLHEVPAAWLICQHIKRSNGHSQFQSIFTVSVHPRYILSFSCVLHCPGPSTIICLQFYSVPVCVFVFADNENPFLPPSKNDRWQTKGRSVFLNFLQGHQMGIIIVYVSGLPGPLRYPALQSWISPRPASRTSMMDDH